MANITATQVKALRDQTGLPMMECKTALAEVSGDVEAAKELLAKKHRGKMQDRSDRVTGEGRVAFWLDDTKTTGAIIELRCETAPVAKTDRFIELAAGIAQAVARQEEPSPDAGVVKTLPWPPQPERTVNDEMVEVYGLLRETMNLGRCRRVAGAYLCGYVHHDGKTGVVIALDAVPKDEQLGIDLCHHVAFARPQAITRDGIPPEQVEKVRRLAREVAEGEGKPAAIIDKIVEGKVNAFCAENSLMEQEHVKVSKTKVGDVLQQGGVNAVSDVALVRVGA